MTTEAARTQFAPVVIGASNCPATHKLCDWLTRQGLEFVYAERSTLSNATSVDVGAKVYPLPRLVCEHGTEDGVTPDGAAELLQLPRHAARDEYDVVIVGGGPAGLSAAIHGAAEGLSTLLVEAYAVGGQASNSQAIENYAGFEAPINGSKLAQAMQRQGERLGAEILVARQVVDIQNVPDNWWRLKLDSGQAVWAQVVILAVGAQFKVIPANDEARFIGAGVYYGLTDRDLVNCGNQVVVVGGGNSAGQAALAFQRQGKQVTLVVRSDSLRHDMSKYLVDEVSKAASIAILYEAQVAGVEGHDRLNEVTIKYKDGEEKKLDCSALFVFAGNEPETGWLDHIAMRDKAGFIQTYRDLLVRDKDSMSGKASTLFAIGDVRSGSTKRVAVAAAEGAEAIARAWQIIHGGANAQEQAK